MKKHSETDQTEEKGKNDNKRKVKTGNIIKGEDLGQVKGRSDNRPGADVAGEWETDTWKKA